MAFGMPLAPEPMSQDPDDHVHRLIGSMTRAEKRYFKLYATRHVVGGASHYSQLFDAVAAMPVYDEQEIHRRFAGEAFLRRFTVMKHRLYETILGSLEAFHANSSIDARLRRSLHQTELLFQRGLYVDAQRVLRGAKALATQHGRTAVLLDVLAWERRLMERANYQGVSAADVQRVVQDGAALRTAMEEEDELWSLKSRSFMLLYSEGKARSEERATALRELQAHPLLQDGAVPLTPKARYLHHHVRSAVAFALNDLPTCEQQLALNDALLLKEELHFRDEPNLRLGVMSNLAYVRMRLGQHAQALQGLKEFKLVPAQLPVAPSADMELKVFAMGASLELTVLCRMGEFDKAVAKLDAVQEQCARYSGRLSVLRLSSIRFQAAWACFGAGDMEGARRWSQELLNAKGVDQHPEIHSLGRLLYLLVLLGLGRTDLLTYELRNVDRFLRSHERDHGVERELVQYVRKRLRTTSLAEHQQAHTELVAGLTELEKDPLELGVFDHFDPLCYAIAQASGRPMSHVARERCSAISGGSTPTSKRRAA
jgi:hypothetical protein